MPCNVSVQGAFQLTPSARRATATAKGVTKVINISIHALREESDLLTSRDGRPSGNFNPRSPWGERRNHSFQIFAYARFQSTPSARRATRQLCDRLCNQSDFNPRPPRGGRQLRHKGGLGLIEISIHALREESDDLPQGEQAAAMGISIHALREEGDFGKAVTISAPVNISIHALRGESDGTIRSRFLRMLDFNPRPPRGERPASFATGSAINLISIHALLAEGDNFGTKVVLA